MKKLFNKPNSAKYLKNGLLILLILIIVLRIITLKQPIKDDSPETDIQLGEYEYLYTYTTGPISYSLATSSRYEFEERIEENIPYFQAQYDNSSIIGATITKPIIRSKKCDNINIIKFNLENVPEAKYIQENHESGATICYWQGKVGKNRYLYSYNIAYNKILYTLDYRTFNKENLLPKGKIKLNSQDESYEFNLSDYFE